MNEAFLNAFACHFPQGPQPDSNMCTPGLNSFKLCFSKLQNVTAQIEERDKENMSRSEGHSAAGNGTRPTFR